MTRRSLLKTTAVPAFAQAVLSNPIVEENKRPGDTSWQLKYYRRDRANGSGLRSPEIEGYASDTSVYPGESLDLMVSADPARKFTIDFYRTGYYGGKGARQLLRVGPLDAVPQEVPLMGMERVRECSWKPAYSLRVPNDWRSGVYLAKLSLVGLPAQSYIIFVVKERRAAEVLFQVSDFTWQAYNKWPGWDSMYDTGINYTRNTFSYTGPHVRVSFDRPYGFYGQVHDVVLSNGSGEYLLWEHPMSYWLEQHGYDVVYCSNLDTDREPEMLTRSKVFLSVAHDEYWTRRMYENVKTARDRGVSIGFFSGNAVCQELLTYKSSVTGKPLRVIARDKRFQDEDLLMGVQSYGPGYGDWTVTRADHWMFDGTGMKNGDSIVGLVGWEYHGSPCQQIPGLVEVARASLSPRSPRPGQDADGWHSAVVYPGPKGNWVFNAGTIWWPEGLSCPPGHVPAGSQIARTTGPDERVQKMTANLLRRMLRDSPLKL
jgi:N,N-dimethylformamidase beta subunit-like protein